MGRSSPQAQFYFKLMDPKSARRPGRIHSRGHIVVKLY